MPASDADAGTLIADRFLKLSGADIGFRPTSRLAEVQRADV
jgi:hypothetical protein